jgi:autoinducer 2-degrading protein
MHVTLVHVRIRPESLEAFVEATRNNHEHSIQEPGNRRFDVLQDPQDPTRFILYEACVDEAAAKAHKDTAYHLAWGDAVAGMMAEPRRGEPMNGPFPRHKNRLFLALKSPSCRASCSAPGRCRGRRSRWRPTASGC